MSTSARDGTGVREAFTSLLETVVDLLSYKKLEDKCNRKLARESQKRLSSSLSFSTQNLYEAASDMRRSSHNSSPNSMGDTDATSDGYSSLSTSPRGSEVEFDPESMSLRDLESKGNNFYLELAGRLSVYMAYADRQRQRDLEQLEIRRVTEYAEFKRKFLDVANCVVHFSPAIESASVDSRHHHLHHRQPSGILVDDDSDDTIFPLDASFEEPPEP